MGPRSYSFLDVAALPAIGPRFAAGEALVVLDTDLSTVLWANGAGTLLFGGSDPVDFIGSDPGLRGPVRRQIQATSGFPRIGENRNLVLRLAGGLFSRTTSFLATEIELPDGEAGIMLATRLQHASRSTAIDGLSGDGQFAALVDGEGNIVASADGFGELGIGPATLAALAADVRHEADRMVKRPLRAAAGLLPAGIALLGGEPPLSLLIVVDEALDESDGWPATGRSESAAEVATPEPEPETPGEVIAPVARQDSEDGWYFHGRSDEELPESSSTARPAAPAPETDEAPLRAPERAAVPVRFVWRTDAEGRFSAISDEFRAAFGDAATDVLGRGFTDVARALDLDPTGEIAGLLSRRDTWSGRSVLWPVEGTDLRVPVDLAALPVYGRDRNFEGFRGFGVARMGDAVVDPDALGLSLGAPIADVAEAQEATGPDHFQGETPLPAVDPTPERHDAEKVILLAERRQSPLRDLSAAEQSTFREIGERLRSSGIEPVNEAPEPTPAAAIDAVPTDISPTVDVSGGDAPQVSGEPRTAEPDPVEQAEAAEDATSPEPREEEAPPAPEAVAEDDIEPIIGDRELPDYPHAQGPETPHAIDLGAYADASYDHASSPATDDVEPDTVQSVGAPASEAAAEPIASGGDSSEDESGSHLQADDTLADATPVAAADLVGSLEPLENGIGTLSRADELFSNEDAEPESDDADIAAPSAIGSSIDAPRMAREDASGIGTLSPADEYLEGIEEPAALPPADAAADAHGGPLDVPSAIDGNEDSEAHGARQDSDQERVPQVSSVETAVLSGLPLPILIHRGDTLCFANKEFYELTGYESLSELDGAGGLGALFADPFEIGPERKPRLRVKDGSEVDVDAFLQSVAWNDGKALLLSLRPVPPTAPAAAVAAETDVDARLLELRTIIDTATDGVVLIENDGTIRSISRPAEALFGFEAADVRGKPFASLFAMESQRAAREYLASLAENGVASVLNDGREVIGREAQGRFIPLFMTIGRLPKDSGYCAVVRDITQFKRAEEELTQARAQAERASSQKTDFLARVSHEIRTPLNAIIGFSELMLDEKFGPITNERYKDYLRDINRSGNHVLDLVNDLLDISKIEAGQLELSYEAVSLNEVLSDAVAMMQPQANRERVIIRSSFPTKLPEVVADLRSIRQIALNLLSNAIRYTPAGGQVIVSTAYEHTGEILMRVRDTGIGMAAAEIEQALKPFKQINALKRPRGDGTGLGLPLTKAMVEANRARFQIQSNPGEGTLVEITFPSTRVLAH